MKLLKVHHNSEPHNSKCISEDNLYINFYYIQSDIKHTFATDLYQLIYGDLAHTFLKPCVNPY